MQIQAKDLRKRLFQWDLTRVVLFFLINLTLWPTVDSAVKRIHSPHPESATTLDWLMWLAWIPVSEFLTVDTHVWGDYVYVWTGVDLRFGVWLFTMPAAVALDLLWLRGRSWAGKVRTVSWSIACVSYFALLVLSPQDPKYDYFIWSQYIAYWKWAWWIQVYAVTSIAIMWIGVILVTGCIVYRQWQLSAPRLAPAIAALLSLGIPGIGQIASGRRRRGLVFLLIGVVVWPMSLFLYQIPSVAWWLFSSWDAYKLNRARAPSRGKAT